MQLRPLGATSTYVSPIGLGTVKLGRNLAVKYPKSFKVPDNKEVVNLLDTAAECGINLLDTAPAYGNSEQRLGELLPKVSPHNWLICTKVGEVFDESNGKSHYDFTPEYIRRSIQASCRRLKREALDIVLIHSNGDDLNIIKKMGALEVLKQLKQEGLIIYTGFSGKTVEGGLLAAESSDVLMVTHNLSYQEERPVIELAHNRGLGVLIKKSLVSGHIVSDDVQDPIQKSYDAIFSLAGVSSVISGTLNPQHIRENVLKAVQAIQNNN